MMKRSSTILFIEVAAVLLFLGWVFLPSQTDLEVRLPIPENDPSNIVVETEEPENTGTLERGPGIPSQDEGVWSQFRGGDRQAMVSDPNLPADWFTQTPRSLWKRSVGEGHAGVVIQQGCVYLIDYDEEKKEDVIRCLSLEGGEEVWNYSYSSKVKRNHGMSRTVPAIQGDCLVTLGPRCHVHCLNPETGDLYWKKDLVQEYGTRIPEWYAGQCPLIEEDRVILAPGGECLMTALSLQTGETLWETPNPDGWEMTHSSITPLLFDGKKQYVWSASDGVVGVSSESGALLWTYPEWKIKIANIPSPLDVGGGRIFLSGGYDAGGEFLQIHETDSGLEIESLLKTNPEVFGSDQQTPIHFRNSIFGIIPGGKLACLSQSGDQLWVNEDDHFGLGPYLMVNNQLLVLDDNEKKPGQLCLFDINESGYKKIASWKVIEGHDAWAPMAYANGKLVLRDSTTLICLQLSGSSPS